MKDRRECNKNPKISLDSTTLKYGSLNIQYIAIFKSFVVYFPPFHVSALEKDAKSHISFGLPKTELNMENVLDIGFSIKDLFIITTRVLTTKALGHVYSWKQLV